MNKDISVNNAIKRGQLMVNLPVFIVLFGFPSLSWYLSYQNIIPEWGILVASGCGFLFSWLIWSYLITKWRIWAFENVRNVHELKKRAVEAKLIWSDNHIFEKTEIRTKNEKIKLKKIQEKFALEDVYKEDYSVPPITKIYYSKFDYSIQLIIAIVVIFLGSYINFNGNIEIKNLVLGTIIILIGVYSGFLGYKKASYKEPIITINDKGISSRNIGFKNWSEIKNEEVITEGSGKSEKTYLFYWYDNNEYEQIDIDELNISHRKLENLLRTYRIRFNKKTI